MGYFYGERLANAQWNHIGERVQIVGDGMSSQNIGSQMSDQHRDNGKEANFCRDHECNGNTQSQDIFYRRGAWTGKLMVELQWFHVASIAPVGCHSHQ